MGTQVIDTVRTPAANRSLPSAKPPGGSLIDVLAPEDQVLLARLLTEPAEYIDHPSFSKRSLERELWGNESRLVHPAATRFVEPPDQITDAVVAGERLPALTYAQETHLFSRFNYARMQVKTILAKFAGKRLASGATRRLLAWGHRALTARSVIVRINLPLVLAMAKRTRLSNVDFSEMVSEGNMALLRSVEKFDCSRGYKFSTYSCRAILKAFSRVAMRASRYRGRFPAEFDPAMERSDHLERRRVGIEEDCVDELKQILLDNLAGLSEVERTVIRERFALERCEEDGRPAPKTLEQVGQIIGVTKERVRQIQNNALRKIRAALENTYLAA
jgi:RNA polymerase sigma factor (sigma-70 family)